MEDTNPAAPYNTCRALKTIHKPNLIMSIKNNFISKLFCGPCDMKEIQF